MGNSKNRKQQRRPNVTTDTTGSAPAAVEDQAAGNSNRKTAAGSEVDKSPEMLRLQQENTRLENEKLVEEIHQLKKPSIRKPETWSTSAVALVGIGGLLLQYLYLNTDKKLADAEKAQAEIQRDLALIEVKEHKLDAVSAKQDLQAAIAEKTAAIMQRDAAVKDEQQAKRSLAEAEAKLAKTVEDGNAKVLEFALVERDLTSARKMLQDTYAAMGERFDADTTVIPAGQPVTVEGTVVDATGKPIAGAQVHVAREIDSALLAQAATDKVGHFSIQLESGPSIWLYATSAGYVNRLLQDLAGDVSHRLRLVMVSQGAPNVIE